MLPHFMHDQMVNTIRNSLKKLSLTKPVAALAKVICNINLPLYKLYSLVWILGEQVLTLKNNITQFRFVFVKTINIIYNHLAIHFKNDLSIYIGCSMKRFVKKSVHE